MLFYLFPSEIPELVAFIEGVADTILEDQPLYQSRWDDRLFTFDVWLKQIREIKKRISRYGSKLHLSGALFSEHLFEGYLALFSAHCILLYIKDRKHADPKFVRVAELLFIP